MNGWNGRHFVLLIDRPAAQLYTPCSVHPTRDNAREAAGRYPGAYVVALLDHDPGDEDAQR